MKEFSKSSKIGIIGAGTMGSGIAQVAASAGHSTILFDVDPAVLKKAEASLKSLFDKLIEKGKYTRDQADQLLHRISFSTTMNDFHSCELVMEAIIEKLEVKQSVFSQLEKIVSESCVLATNTSSLSVTSIAAACTNPERVIGIHFFNPAPLMPLVEIIPAISTHENLPISLKQLITDWGKSVVIVKDTPGFIVNRVARSFYGESIRIHEESWEGIPSGTIGFSTIDWAMKEIGGFKMGPFELMDLIGNDINYTVTETVWTQFFYDPKFKPSLTQKRLFEAKRFGKKSNIGYYNYSLPQPFPAALKDLVLAEKIFMRVISMLINEAVDALYLNVANRDDLDTAMLKGVNYPKGLLKWCDEIGAQKILDSLNGLREFYGEERYRPSPLLKKMASENKKFYS